jgi:hypothetical protein
LVVVDVLAPAGVTVRRQPPAPGLVRGPWPRYRPPIVVDVQGGSTVKLINTDGMAFIGPGSEWLWTAVSGIVLAVTFLAIYRQLRMQRAANGFAQMQELQDRWYTERMRQMKLRLALALKRGDDPDLRVLVGVVGAFFDQLGYLHRRGYVAADTLANTSDSLLVDALRWWTLLELTVKQWQAEYGASEMAEFEHLASEGRRWMAQHGVLEFKTDPASIAARLDWIIDGQTRRLRIEQEISAGVLPALPEAPVAA